MAGFLILFVFGALCFFAGAILLRGSDTALTQLARGELSGRFPPRYIAGMALLGVGLACLLVAAASPARWWVSG